MADSTRGIVYYARRDGLVKIGTTTNLRQRITALRAELVAIEPGGGQVERRRHRRFAAHRVHGEWFAPHAELDEHIDALGPLDESLTAAGPYLGGWAFPVEGVEF